MTLTTLQTFERRSGLFSLALSEVCDIHPAMHAFSVVWQVLMVNLWETEVGRQSAVHSSVIRGIMESYLRQFRHVGYVAVC